jgi:hypothetical protein
MSDGTPIQTEERARRGHTRRPPLAEIDSWEFWQAWRRGERARVLPWILLLAGFSIVLAAMYSFFFVSSVLSQDSIAPIGLLIVYAGFLFWLWRRISSRRAFALAVVGAMTLVSVVAFGVWFALYWLSGWNVWAGIFGTAALGIAGLLVGLPGLNAMARLQNRSQS